LLLPQITASLVLGLEVYQLHVWLREITPLIWCRLLVRSDSTIADLHDMLQIAMGWDDAHLHRFRIRGKDYGLSRIGGIGFRDDPHQVRLDDFHFRPNERFLYEYDFGDQGHHQLVYRTVFGKLTLSSPRWYMCRCQTTKPRSFSPLADLLPKRTAPELLYLEAKFAALMSYGVTVDVLGELLPIGTQLNATTVQRHLLRVAERMEHELGEEQVMFVEGCPAEWERLPPPDVPLTVGLDGGYVHARDDRSRKAGWFEVIVGKSLPDEGASKCFGFVHTYDTKPKRRLFEVLKS
jgi:Plasmid pRiA4b ORF-3-like protein